jgi:hypothetical protein
MNDKSYIHREIAISCVFVVVSCAISIELGAPRICCFTCALPTVRTIIILVILVLVTISVAFTLLPAGCIFVIADILTVIRQWLLAQAPKIGFILQVFIVVVVVVVSGSLRIGGHVGCVRGPWCNRSGEPLRSSPRDVIRERAGVPNVHIMAVAQDCLVSQSKVS